MQLHYDDDFVEAAIFIAASGKRTGVPPLQVRRFHAARERCYSVLDADERNAAFFRLHLEWFREWGLERLLLGLLEDYPQLTSALNALAFRKVRAKKDEAAELYVSAEKGRSGVVAMRPERFERDDAVRHFLEHELTHLKDMVDPAFAYTPEIRCRDLNPSHQRIVRERYRLLWDITIDGRLGRSIERGRHRAGFESAFSFWPESRRDEVFSTLWATRTPRHEQLMALASDPRDLNHATRPLPGGSCPLCGFSTFEWAEPVSDDAIRAVIEREFPAWAPSHGVCRRCAEIYATAGRYADAIPQ
jgi:hypothetical protein